MQYMGKFVRRVDLICQPLLANGILGTRSNETVIVSNNHSLSIYSRTLTRYSMRQEYLSPEQLDLDCVTPGGKGHLDECRLLHGIWSPQQTLYMEDVEHFGWTCGPNEVYVGQTVDLLQLNLTCDVRPQQLQRPFLSLPLAAFPRCRLRVLSRPFAR